MEWNFLFELLQKRGFSQRWIDWIKSLLTTARSLILINNSLGKWIWNKKGLKQGNPLSPMLFILVADTLTQILRCARSEELLHGIGPS